MDSSYSEVVVLVEEGRRPILAVGDDNSGYYYFNLVSYTINNDLYIFEFESTDNNSITSGANAKIIRRIQLTSTGWDLSSFEETPILSPIKIIEYGITSYAEANVAWTLGNNLIATKSDSDLLYRLSHEPDGTMEFTAISNGELNAIILSNNAGWSESDPVKLNEVFHLTYGETILKDAADAFDSGFALIAKQTQTVNNTVTSKTFHLLKAYRSGGWSSYVFTFGSYDSGVITIATLSYPNVWTNSTVTIPTTAENITYNSSTTYSSGTVGEAINSKSTVSVSASGTATDEISYITVNGVEKKIASGTSVEDYTSAEIDALWAAN